MADRSAGSGMPRWLWEPPLGAIQAHIALGPRAALTPELREALAAFTRAARRDDAEVSGAGQVRDQR